MIFHHNISNIYPVITTAYLVTTKLYQNDLLEEPKVVYAVKKFHAC
jgi:hypothetical protein